MSGKCLKGVWKVSGRFLKGVCVGHLEGVWRISGWLIDGVWKVSGVCPEGVWRGKVSGKCLESGCLEGVQKVSRRCLKNL